VKLFSLMTAAALLLPAPAQAEIAPISSCVAMVLPRSGALDKITLDSLDNFIAMSWIARDPRYVMAIYAPETRCHTDLCNAERTRYREEAIGAHFTGRGIAADRIRLIGLDEGFSLFGRVPERAAIVAVHRPGAAMPSCDASQASRTD
jgi:hypothetical protein